MMRKPAAMPDQPMICQYGEAFSSLASRRMVLMGECAPRRPNRTSDIMMGMPMKATQAKYTNTKAPPPFSPAT